VDPVVVVVPEFVVDASEVVVVVPEVVVVVPEVVVVVLDPQQLREQQLQAKILILQLILIPMPEDY
jgi:hypothetical protein